MVWRTNRLRSSQQCAVAAGKLIRERRRRRTRIRARASLGICAHLLGCPYGARTLAGLGRGCGIPAIPRSGCRCSVEISRAFAHPDRLLRLSRKSDRPLSARSRQGEGAVLKSNETSVSSMHPVAQRPSFRLQVVSWSSSRHGLMVSSNMIKRSQRSSR
jgi:hypothetical protein